MFGLHTGTLVAVGIWFCVWLVAMIAGFILTQRENRRQSRR